MNRWFVMLRSSQGFPIPLLASSAEDDLALFTSEGEAREAIKGNMWAEAFGFEIYEWQRRIA